MYIAIAHCHILFYLKYVCFFYKIDLTYEINCTAGGGATEATPGGGRESSECDKTVGREAAARAGGSDCSEGGALLQGWPPQETQQRHQTGGYTSSSAVSLNLGSAHQVFNLHVLRCFYVYFFMYFLITSVHLSFGVHVFHVLITVTSILLST